MRSGKIILHRKKQAFNAAFGITKATLPELAADLSALHTIEKENYQRLQFDRRRQSYLLGRLAAKKAVTALTGAASNSFYIDTGIFEFPVVKNAGENIQVSISHCDDIGAALAFPEEHPLGLDVERINGERSEVMQTQMSAAELAIIQNSDILLTIAWTIKEALSKILRTGLTMDLRLAEIKSLQKTGNYYTAEFCNFAQYKAVAFCTENYACCVVLPGKTTADIDELYTCFMKTAI